MVVEVLDIPTDNTDSIQLPVTTPQWLKPYLAAAQRSGLTDHWDQTISLQEPITGADAAVMLQNALDLTVSAQLLEENPSVYENISSRAAASLTVMAENGIVMDADTVLTRGDTAKVLYRVSKLSLDAPGMAVFRIQQ